ncbi:MAG: aldehyde dehydrogenase [Clostridia bacterium]|nr:aldehyde dehydrogenase [Clostridia bacterium]
MTIHELNILQHNAFAQNHPYTVDERIVALERLLEAITLREQEIIAALQYDLGKCESESYMTEIGLVRSEIHHTIRHLNRWSAPRRVRTSLSQFPGRCLLVKEPYGVVLVMAPWNYPFLLSMMPFVGALAAGNHVILKPSNYAPATSRILFQLVSECFPVEQAAVVLGGREENRQLLDEHFDYIFFTGGKQVGQLVAEKAARHLTPTTLELGGKSPCIVDDSADIRLAARRIAFGKGINAGQTCVAPDYVLVHSSVMQKLMDEIAACWLDFYGNALENPAWPRMISPRHYERAMGLISGEHIYFGGMGDGIRIAPTLLDKVTWASPIMQEEIFAPILPVLPFDRLDDAIRQIAIREKPLALYLFTKRASVKDKVVSRLSFGGGCINDTVMHLASCHLPFGGVGESGMGRYHGKYTFDTFTHEKAVLKKSRLFDFKFRYPPYTEKKLNTIKKLLK